MSLRKCKALHKPQLFAQSFSDPGDIDRPTMKHWECKKCNRIWSEEV